MEVIKDPEVDELIERGLTSLGDQDALLILKANGEVGLTCKGVTPDMLGAAMRGETSLESISMAFRLAYYLATRSADDDFLEQVDDWYDKVMSEEARKH